MPTFDNKNVLDALSAPLGELIASVGRGVADAQRELDLASIQALREVYESDEDLYRDLQRIGYRPTWYHIPEAEGELQVALTVTGEAATGGPGGGSASAPTRRLRVYAAPIHAGYSSRFDFKLEASSRVKFRVVPVPPATTAEALQVVPALLGLTVNEALARLALLGIESDAPEAAALDAQVTTQSPAAGTILVEGQGVTLGIE
ncbi:MAG: PASTA domain-containing protein [Myxococcales bacterium]|nr:PASTA domain-containing protein [Myxococcales bacterium]